MPPARSKLEIEDPNLQAASLLYDMAALQPTERSQFGYKRAARAIVGLPVSVAELVEARALRDVPFIGPSSERIIVEFVERGAAVSVDAAIERSGKRRRIEEKRALRRAFFSHYGLQQALALRRPAATVNLAAFRGDFQMHSTFSDGAESLATLAEACAELGHGCLGITDHSHGLPIARGMSMITVARQHREIARLNARFGSRFRIFRGIEANILGDGTLDLQPDERRGFEFVVASPHSLLRRPDDQTARMLRAVRAPGVAILGHPRGRVFNTRAGISADWPRVFEAAAELEVAIEIDGNWHRQDLDYELAAQALGAGCVFALDSDAHSVGELRFSQYAVAHARLARIPAARVINCWSNEQLEDWMARCQRRVRTALA